MVSEKSSGCGESFGTVRVTHVDFANDAVIFVRTTEVLADALESLSEEAEPLGLRVSWIKTKVQAFGGILDATIASIPVNDENVEITQTFTYLGSVIHSSTCCELEVNRRLGRAWSAMNSLDEGVWRCRYLCKRTKVRVSFTGPPGAAVFL